MIRSTFSSIQTAKSGLSVSQQLLDVTGQNITNVNTDGYTRQRVDIYSVGYLSGPVQYKYDPWSIGQGVGSYGPSQIRDPFLDERYRTEASKVAMQDVMADSLSELEAIFGEITRDGIDALMSDMVTQLQALSATPSDPVIEGVVKTAAQMVTQMFNNYSKQLSDIKDQHESYLDDSVNEANRLMEQIAELNDQIRELNIHGNPALELNDARNVLIDELSTHMNIEVQTRLEPIGSGEYVEELYIESVDITDATGNPFILVDNDHHSQLQRGEDANGDMTIAIDSTLKSIRTEDTAHTATWETIVDKTAGINDPKEGTIAGYIAFLNNEAEFTDSNTYSIEDRGIQYYQSMLDELANTFATELNNLNREPLTWNADGTVATWAEKPLFSSTDGGEITAENIQISDAWRGTTTSYITHTTEEPIPTGELDAAGNPIYTDNSALNDNIMRMIDVFTKDITFTHDFNGTPNDQTDDNFLFEGTLQEFMSFATSTLDNQIRDTNALYESYGQTLLAIDTSRASISGVSLDEEAINLIMYNQAYSAASRFMTTIDEALETLINSTGRVGL